MRLMRLVNWLEQGRSRHVIGVAGTLLFFAFWLLTFYLGAAIFGALEMLIQWILQGGLA